MSRYLGWLSIGLLLLVRPAAAEPVRIMSFNIRYGTAPDGDNAWQLRRETALSVAADFAPHLLGLQEALRDQVDAMRERLPHLGSLGPGREADGGGEYSALLFDQRRFDVLSADAFWLSTTPEVRGSVSWGAGCTRICTFARLVDRVTNQVFCVANTHWDHVSQPARLQGAQLMAQRLGVYKDSLIVMGDFNAGPTNQARLALANLGLRDAFVELYPNEANSGTFHGFQPQAKSEKIDAILASPSWQILEAAIIRPQSGEPYPSDHYPVTAVVELPPVERPASHAK